MAEKITKPELIRQDGVNALVKIGGDPQLFRLLVHREAHTRSASAEALARLRSKEALPYLIAGLGFTGIRDMGNRSVLC